MQKNNFLILAAALALFSCPLLTAEMVKTEKADRRTKTSFKSLDYIDSELPAPGDFNINRAGPY